MMASTPASFALFKASSRSLLYGFIDKVGMGIDEHHVYFTLLPGAISAGNGGKGHVAVLIGSRQNHALGEDSPQFNGL
jgi:hypothetical protein